MAVVVTETRHEGLILAYDAEAAVLPFRIVKFGTKDGWVIQAAGPTDLLWGVAKFKGGDRLYQQTGFIAPVTGGIVAAPVNTHLDVVLTEIAEIEYGGTVTRGQPLTSDAQGRGVAAVAGNNLIGYAAVSGVVGDIGNVLINRSTL